MKGMNMAMALITGVGGLVGSECARFFFKKGISILGIDNDMRAKFFGAEASTTWNTKKLAHELKDRFIMHDIDIRDVSAIEAIYKDYTSRIDIVIHTAAQPSHDWAAKEPFTDFSVNASGTLNLLEMTRRYCLDVPFIYTSTNKVYGDTPNYLPIVERETRVEIDVQHPYAKYGIDESMSIDHCKHSLFGVSKAAADLMVQEYGRYFGMKTACFRGGCLTGPAHSGTKLHGFLSYLMKCAMTGTPYTIIGYKGKQVRDNIHSYDLANAFYEFYKKPRSGEVYNIGGSRFSNCSMMEAVALCEEITGKNMNISYVEENRIGDHIWWISDIRRFQDHYPEWSYTRNVKDILEEIFEINKDRWCQIKSAVVNTVYE